MKKHRWILVLLCLTILLTIYFYPVKVEKELSGMVFYNSEYGAAEPCQLSINGARSRHPFEKDEYVGRFALDFDNRTTLYNARMHSSMSDDGVSFMTYLTDQGYIILGYFVAPKSFDWIYICMKGPDGKKIEAMAPATSEESASAIKQQTLEYVRNRGFVLPDNY